MDLLLVGASHRTATVDVRGRLARAAASLAGGRPASVAELLILSTCHRVEVVAIAHDVRAAERELRVILAADDASLSEPARTDRGVGVPVRERVGGSAGAQPPGNIYVHVGRSALLHLARVAAGLDSLIVGEAEISGQIRRAVAAGRGAGLVGPVLERVTAGVLRASGRARSETRIGQGTTSAATAAVSLLEREWGSLEGRSVLVVGAGEAGRQTLDRLLKRRASRLLVASRSTHHAVQAAGKTCATVVPLDTLAAVLDTVDAVIAATRGDGFLIDREICRSAARSRRTLEIVDLSVPRVVDPVVAELVGVSLHTVDDLGEVVRDSVRRREREIPAVERIVADESARTYQQFIERYSRPSAAVA